MATARIALPDVGAPDPEQKTSPILDETELDEREGVSGWEPDAPCCYFNDEAFGIGDYVRSGAELLKCARGGVWVRVDEDDPQA